MESTPVAAALAEAEAAAERFQQALELDLFRCLDGDLGRLIERSHRLEARLTGRHRSTTASELLLAPTT